MEGNSNVVKKRLDPFFFKQIYLTAKNLTASFIFINFIKTFFIPEDIIFGDTILYVTVIYNGETESASVWFNIGEKPILTFEKGLYVLFVVLLIIIIFIVIVNFYRIRKHGKILWKHHH